MTHILTRACYCARPMTLSVSAQTPHPKLITAEWWRSSTIVKARQRSGYDDSGDTVELMAAILDVTDEEEAKTALLPSIPNSEPFRMSAHDFVSGKKVTRGYAHAAIIQMLDWGAEPERLRTVFSDGHVDYALTRWRSWRAEVVTAARHGRSAEDLREIAGKNVGWSEVHAVLVTHGLHEIYPVKMNDRRSPASAVTLRRAVVELQAEGVLTNSGIAARVGTSRQNVGNILARHRAGAFPELASA